MSLQTGIVKCVFSRILRTMFAGSETLTLVYLPMWMNLPGYVGGLATAFIFHYTQVEGVKLNQKKVSHPYHHEY